MANIKPLIRDNGNFSEAQAGDTVDPLYGGTGKTSYTPYTVSETPPSSPNLGDRWVKPSTGRKYEWYDDGTSTQWVELDNTVITTTVEASGNIDGGRVDSPSGGVSIIDCGSIA